MNGQDKQITNFAVKIAGLTPVAFLGLMKYMEIPVFTDEKEKNGLPKYRNPDDMIVDCLNYFAGANRRERRTIMRLVDQALREKE